MKRTLIQQYSSAITQGFIKEAETLKSLKHRLTKGELRELLVSNILERFLPQHINIGSGLIINNKGNQSNQIDIIIYDSRILPPFIKEKNMGVYPAESVIATIEIKSKASKINVMNAEKVAIKIHQKIYQTDPILKIIDDSYCRTLNTFFSFDGDFRELMEKHSGRDWLIKNIKYLSILCFVNKFSWANINDPQTGHGMWNLQKYSENTREETKRFIAILIDTIYYISQQRYGILSAHQGWIGRYIRDWE